jgi:hypothetical protein
MRIHPAFNQYTRFLVSPSQINRAEFDAFIENIPAEEVSSLAKSMILTTDTKDASEVNFRNLVLARLYRKNNSKKYLALRHNSLITAFGRYSLHASLAFLASAAISGTGLYFKDFIAIDGRISLAVTFAIAAIIAVSCYFKAKKDFAQLYCQHNLKYSYSTLDIAEILRQQDTILATRNNVVTQRAQLAALASAGTSSTKEGVAVRAVEGMAAINNLAYPKAAQFLTNQPFKFAASYTALEFANYLIIGQVGRTNAVFALILGFVPFVIGASIEGQWSKQARNAAAVFILARLFDVFISEEYVASFIPKIFFASCALYTMVELGKMAKHYYNDALTRHRVTTAINRLRSTATAAEAAMTTIAHIAVPAAAGMGSPLAATVPTAPTAGLPAATVSAMPAVQTATLPAAGIAPTTAASVPLPITSATADDVNEQVRQRVEININRISSFNFFAASVPAVASVSILGLSYFSTTLDFKTNLIIAAPLLLLSTLLANYQAPAYNLN